MEIDGKTEEESKCLELIKERAEDIDNEKKRFFTII